MKMFSCAKAFLSPFSLAGVSSRFFVLAIAFLILMAPLRAQINSVMPFTFTTLAGSAIVGSTDGTGIAARFTYPTSMAVDKAGNIYVTDRDIRTIRKITSSGVVSTLAGNVGIPAFAGSADGTGTAARFHVLSGIAVDAEGIVYVADWGDQTIRKITPAGVATTFAGSAGNFGSGTIDGVGIAARFVSPNDVALDGAGNVYVADFKSVRKITPAGVVTTFAVLADRADSLAVNEDGNVYVVDASGIYYFEDHPVGHGDNFRGCFRYSELH